MFNPLDHKGIPLDQQIRSWRELNVAPVDPEAVDPYTRCRIITMPACWRRPWATSRSPST